MTFTANALFKKIVWRARNASPRFRASIAAALKDAAELVLAHSKSQYLTRTRSSYAFRRGNQTVDVPFWKVKGLAVRTGRLRASMSKGPVTRIGSRHKIQVGTNVFYGYLWEKGFTHASGKYMRPRPFLGPAIDDKRNAINRILSRGVRIL